MGSRGGGGGRDGRSGSCIDFFFFKQKTAYEIYQCDWSSDVCSSDLATNISLENQVKMMGGEGY